MKFLDIAKVYTRSGTGGRGCVSFRREAHLEFGGPDGGRGGRGGDVVAEVTEGLNTLIDFRYRPHFFARNGRPGMGGQRSGKDGDDIVLKLPMGTEILEEDGETLIADMTQAGRRVVLAKGGAGGAGNLYFKSSTNQAPRKARPGRPGVERTIWLRLKMIADAGLLGLPNAGKSAFLSATSNARPRVAAYPFTTLHPTLGVVDAGGGREFVLADIPGLIGGACAGRGIGARFLGHIERCAVLLHLVDGAAHDPVEDYKTIIRELENHGKLIDKPRVTALNKVDAVPAEIVAELQHLLGQETGDQVFAISAVARTGVGALLRALLAIIDRPEQEETGPWTP
ncbi:MAG: GTPase ObgE [Rhodobacteraceae bacterium]|nr:GTPase ObgE [Paracoccaceae bacterium]